MVDTGIVGQLGDPVYIGAVAVGSMIFNFVYWTFGFLRMGTSGLTAQAFGAQDEEEIRLSLARPILIACVFGAALIVLQSVLLWVVFHLVAASPEVEAGARAYFKIRIWSAPFSLANFALLGWLIGLQRSHLALLLQLFLNGLNAGLDAMFVLHFDLGIRGIAQGTLISEIAAALFGAFLAFWQLNTVRPRFALQRLLDWPSFRRCLVINREIMLRTLCLLLVFAFFTAKSADFGNLLLAANTILMHFVSFTAYFLDGFAFAAEAFVGQAIGRRSRSRLIRSIYLSSAWSGGTALILGLMIYLFGPFAMDFLTASPEVRLEVRRYLLWVAVLPVVSFWCWQLDGIFIGATRTYEMQLAAFRSLVAFLVFWWAFRQIGNHGLWLSMVLFNVMRGFFLGRYLPLLIRSVSRPGFET